MADLADYSRLRPVAVPANGITATGQTLTVRIISIAFIVACLNPWTSFGLNDWDSQLWPLILGALYMFISMPNIRLPVLAVLGNISLILGVFAALAVSDVPYTFEAFRAIANYSTIVVVFIAFRHYLRTYGFPFRLIIWIACAWLAVGLIELYDPALSEFLSARRTSATRGMTALAPEPGFFGTFLFFVCWLLWAASSYRPSSQTIAFSIAAVLSVIFVAKSALSMAYLAFAVTLGIGEFIIYSFLRAAALRRMRIASVRIVAVLLLGILTFGFIFGYSNDDSRLFALVDQFREKPFGEVVAQDESINQRLAAPIIAALGAVHNHLVPGGFDSVERLGTTGALDILKDTAFRDARAGNRIMSWSGALIYELGMFGLIFLAFIFYCALRGRMHLSEGLAMFGLLTTAIPLAFPLVPMLFAVWSLPRGVHVLNTRTS